MKKFTDKLRQKVSQRDTGRVCEGASHQTPLLLRGAAWGLGHVAEQLSLHQRGCFFLYSQLAGQEEAANYPDSAGRSQGKKPHVTGEGGPRARENCVRVCVSSICVTDRAF